MNKTLAARIAFLLAALAPVVLGAAYYGDLPQRMAVHFDIAGNPDGWGGKSGFVIAMAVVHLILLASFALPAFLMRRLPDEWINMPHKDYWLAPERRAETMAGVERSLLWLGVMTMALIAVLLWETFETNLGRRSGLQLGLWALGAYLFAVIAWCIALFRSYRRPGDGAP